MKMKERMERLKWEYYHLMIGMNIRRKGEGRRDNSRLFTIDSHGTIRINGEFTAEHLGEHRIMVKYKSIINEIDL